MASGNQLFPQTVQLTVKSLIYGVIIDFRCWILKNHKLLSDNWFYQNPLKRCLINFRCWKVSREIASSLHILYLVYRRGLIKKSGENTKRNINLWGLFFYIYYSSFLFYIFRSLGLPYMMWNYKRHYFAVHFFSICFTYFSRHSSKFTMFL